MDHRLGHRMGLSFAAVLLAGVAAVPALAGETIIYDAAPVWVDVTPN